MRDSRRRVRALLTAAALLVLPSCILINYPTFKLGVPYRQQAQDFYCGPASILMWRLYDRLAEISQSSIASYIGWTPTGVSVPAIVMGVNHFTNTWDAYWDLPGGVGDPDIIQGQFFSRQITSLDAKLPVIAILWGGLHAGVINGGKWHTDSYSGLDVWDYVYFHDPDQYSGGPDRYRPAGIWTGDCTSQVVAGRIRDPGNANFYTYGYNVGIRGRTDWPPAY